ncbi:aspartyl/glutamyl-tRNA(Asn/Gln) amidotransferase subunit A [Halanaerobium congolense]|jgi:aspartyl-tRNA(Asn)/glutamyl-tRNA(Gln) amidotransferase subunit A|uniref:Glutamyl-tRNA(Gln) amidotransferase subunit A n=1 Tax=Halanaerobium congolense TaxID=54121 RepID=A0A4R8GH11_9FIRM|nr:Asp-tRNA(Asn)/Glu-tRNA(Gln) amidotransferase subunit GatA [Halanaerobium congolense]TDP21596.1 aspartyl/glutamyl-tRNA(Asn/Gln) amidotransferase subunit A [Halanaerobium congolense]TDX44535.1 aspartyl/glutamyl-tRNA(Asn/Gln) amidotransferase subunit A [Halanaerobium congolense]
MNIYDLTIHELKEKISAGELTPGEIKKAFADRINDVEDKVKSYITVTYELAEAQLKDYENKKEKMLAGIPIAVKDNMSTDGIKTSCASKMLENYKPPYNATVVEKLNEAGAVILGKTNMDEFAMGSSTENSAFFVTHNPWNLNHAPGGSSGGSAAAVAAGECAAALGSDTGGSIRQPASYCGVVGLKPTYGMVSRYGLVAFASSLDQIGPITKDVEDSAILMNVIAGHDPQDSTSIAGKKEDYTKYLKEDVSGMKIGIPEEYFNLEFDEEVKASVLAAVEKLKEVGAEVETVHMTDASYALAAYYVIAPAEASSNLARYDGVRYGLRSEHASDVNEMFTNTRHEGFGEEVKRRIMIGTYALSSGYYDAYYLKAQKVRTLIKDDFDRIFNDFDLILTPTAPSTAIELESKSDPLEMYHTDIFTVPVNIAGVPAMSVPCGFDSSEMPIGLQLIGPHFGEGKIIQAAYTLEKLLNINEKRAEL